MKRMKIGRILLAAVLGSLLFLPLSSGQAAEYKYTIVNDFEQGAVCSGFEVAMIEGTWGDPATSASSSVSFGYGESITLTVTAKDPALCASSRSVYFVATYRWNCRASNGKKYSLKSTQFTSCANKRFFIRKGDNDREFYYDLVPE